MLEVPFHGKDGHPLWAYTIERGTPTADTVMFLHAGGPDHHSLVPLAERLTARWQVVLPDIRGYGRSVCRDPASHTWAQYVADAIALLDHVYAERALVVGVGLGTTIALRLAAAYPDRVAAAVLISLEDIEDDEAKARETKFLEDFKHRILEHGLDKAWESILGFFPPIVDAMVCDAIPRSDRESIAAATSIGQDRSFRSVEDLAAIATPTLIIPGIDARHPLELAKQAAAVMPNGELASIAMSKDLRTVDDFANSFADVICSFFLRGTIRPSGE